MTIAGDPNIAALAADDDSGDRRRAQQVAAARRQRRFIINLSIRTVSLIAVLIIWQVFGARVDPSLFTTPSAIASAAVEMIGSGELWEFLAPSLVVLVIGLSLAAVVGVIV